MATAMAMVLLGLGAISTSKNLLKTVMSFQVVVFGANLALFASGLSSQSGLISDSLVFFSIAVGASVESVGLAIVVTVFRKYGTLNPSEIRKLRR
jgi:NADH:ubiquinone oxidoreductase subunit K